MKIKIALAAMCLFGTVAYGQQGPTIIIGTPTPMVSDPYPYLCNILDRQIAATIPLLRAKRARLRELGAKPVLTQAESAEFDSLFRLVNELSMMLQLLQTIYCDCGC